MTTLGGFLAHHTDKKPVRYTQFKPFESGVCRVRQAIPLDSDSESPIQAEVPGGPPTEDGHQIPAAPEAPSRQSLSKQDGFKQLLTVRVPVNVS
ncbi:TPA: hypothetical protein ACH3X1_010653 [Trebouxia sp. C0004]